MEMLCCLHLQRYFPKSAIAGTTTALALWPVQLSVCLSVCMFKYLADALAA